MKFLYKTWLLVLLASTLSQIAVTYQIPITPSGLLIGTGATEPATKDTSLNLRPTISVTNVPRIVLVRTVITRVLSLISNNTTVQ